jgi:hypothetical protein
MERFSCPGTGGSYRPVWRQEDNLLGQCPERNRHEVSTRVASDCGADMHAQPQKKMARAYRIEGALVLYRPAARSQFKAERPLSRAEPWWSVVFWAPLFLRTVLHLVFVCRHRHRGPPITLRESIPSNRRGYPPTADRGTYITCLDCGKKFPYDHKTGQLVDFWGVHDAEALAGVRRRVDELFSPLQDFVGRAGKLNMRISSQLDRSMSRLGILAKGQWSKARRLIASKWAPRSNLKQRQTRPENN